MKEKILTQEIIKELGLDKVSVITADMLEGYTSIGNSAFVGCKSLTSVTIPNSVMSIGWCAFCDCSSLTSFIFPNSLISIGDYAFYRCSSLTSISIPNGVTNLGMRAFSGCKSLVSIIIPNSVKTIGDFAFGGCAGLTSVAIDNSVKSIEYGTFKDCTSLTSLTIGDKIYQPQKITNGKCKAYKAFNGSMKCRGFQYKEGETYELEGKPKLCERGFHACLNLADVFTYYWGKLGKDVFVHEVELEGATAERLKFDSKVVAGKITIGKRIL